MFSETCTEFNNRNATVVAELSGDKDSNILQTDIFAGNANPTPVHTSNKAVGYKVLGSSQNLG